MLKYYIELDTFEDAIKLQKKLMLLGYRYPAAGSSIYKYRRHFCIRYPDHNNDNSKLGIRCFEYVDWRRKKVGPSTIDEFMKAAKKMYKEELERQRILNE